MYEEVFFNKQFKKAKNSPSRWIKKGALLFNLIYYWLK